MGPRSERPPMDWDQAFELHRLGWTYADIAREYGYAYKTVQTKLRSMGAPLRRSNSRRKTKRGQKLVELWRFTREKCSVRTHRSYSRFGSRGIRVCAAWDKSFDAFYDWAVASGYKIGLRLARKDRSGDYDPKNCKWVTASEKMKNREAGRPPSWTLTAFGETKGPAAWARDPRCSVGSDTLRRRIQRGDSPENAITAPADSTRKPGAKSPPKRRARRVIDWDEATRLFLEEGLSKPEVARRIGASYTGVIAAFKRLGVNREERPALTSSLEGVLLRKRWISMHARCTDPANPLYPHSGQKGIRVDPVWNDIEPFVEWARDSGFGPELWLVRLDVRRDYSPENCTWMTRDEASKRRLPPSRPAPSRSPITAFGESKGVVAWSNDSRCSVSTATISARIAKGWSIERAIQEPPQNRGSADAAQTELTAFGTTRGVTAWTRDRRCKVSLTGLMDRLRRGWSPEDAIATPPFEKPLYRR